MLKSHFRVVKRNLERIESEKGGSSAPVPISKLELDDDVVSLKVNVPKKHGQLRVEASLVSAFTHIQTFRNSLAFCFVHALLWHRRPGEC